VSVGVVVSPLKGHEVVPTSVVLDCPRERVLGTAQWSDRVISLGSIEGHLTNLFVVRLEEKLDI